MDAIKIAPKTLGEASPARPPRVLVPMGHRWYVYGHTEIDENGKKSPLIPIRKKISNYRSRSHIQTVMTAADGSNLLYGAALDLDFDGADDRFKTRGKLDHKKMKAFLDETYPVLSRHLCTWTRSTGGRGLGVILFFDPFLLRHEKTGGVTFLAERVQRLVIQVLNAHGFGCDENATGLLRFTPNWRNGRILLHKDEVTIRRVQRDNEPHNVLSLVYNELRRSALFKAPTKKSEVLAGSRFAVKSSADEGLGRIYAHILDSAPETLSLSSSFDDLAQLSGLSVPTLRRYLPKASWLSMESVYGKGVRLTLKPAPELSERAYSIAEQAKVTMSPLSSSAEWALPEPEYVGDGDRNNFLWRRAVILRNEGVALQDAISQLRGEASRIPGAIQSRNCRKLEGIVSSIFRHARETKKAKRTIFPLEALTESQSYGPDLDKPIALAQEDDITNLCALQAEIGLLPVMGSNEEMEKSILKQGGSGDLPPIKPSDEEVLGWMKGFVPSLTHENKVKPLENSVVIKFAAPKNGPTISEVMAIKAKVFRTLREARGAVCRDVHPFDRFARALDRVLGRSTEEDVLAVLLREHQRLSVTKDRGFRYQPPEGKFKRVCEAWSFIPQRMRVEFLN